VGEGDVEQALGSIVRDRRELDRDQPFAVARNVRDPDGNILEIRQGKNLAGVLELTPELLATAKTNRG
jgi:hypothetical protein